MRLAESTTRATYGVASKRCPVGCAPTTRLATARQAESLTKDDVRRVERALQHVYRVVVPSLLKRSSPGWGPGPLSSERSWEFFVQLGDELGEWPQRLFAEQEPTGRSIRRIERAHREEAAGEVISVVRSLPAPVRRVVEARALGVSWKTMTREMPDRAYFSLLDDWRQAVATLHFYHDELVERLT